jgi:branched-chain amino acid transport system permease protein
MTNFLQVLIDAIALGSLYALVALGIGLVFGVMKLVNFAQGDYIMIGAYALVVPSASLTPAMMLGALPVGLMIAGVILVVICLSLATERVAFRPLRQGNSVTLLISSFAVSYLLQHIVMFIHTGRPKAINIGAELTQAIDFFGLRIAAVQLLTIAATAILLAALVIFMKRTPLGIQMRAAAENFEMTRLLGVSANFVISLAFIISGFLAGVVSLLLVVQTGTLEMRMGVMPAVFGFFATVIGGMGSLSGAVLGGFVVGIFSVLLQSYLPLELRPFRDAFVFALVILILVVRPQGLIVVQSARERV